MIAMTKPAICDGCKKDLKDVVPLDAHPVLCFVCSEVDITRRELNGEMGRARQQAAQKSSRRGVYR